MKKSPQSLSELSTQAIKILCREIGPANTARLLNQFSTGMGDYTRDRELIIGNPTLDELVAEIKQRRRKPKAVAITRTRSRSK